MMEFKRFSTQVLLGIFFSALCFFVSVQIAFNAIGNNYIRTYDNEETILVRAAVTAYVNNHFFHSKDSEMIPLKGLEKYFRPEVQAALESGATLKVRREDHDNALVTMILETRNAKIEEQNKKKKKEERMELYTRDEVASNLKEHLIKGWWRIGFGAILFFVLFLAWYFLHDRVVSIVTQYKKGRLYDELEDNDEKNTQVIEQQKNEIAALKVKFTEKVTEYNALEQKFRTFLSQVKEKEKAEKEAIEKAKREQDEEEAMKERAKQRNKELLED